MPRKNEMLGEVTQSPKGGVRTAAASAGFGSSQNTAEQSGKIAAPKQRTWQGPCCKTCKGESCTGHCKF